MKAPDLLLRKDAPQREPEPARTRRRAAHTHTSAVLRQAGRLGPTPSNVGQRLDDVAAGTAAVMGHHIKLGKARRHLVPPSKGANRHLLPHEWAGFVLARLVSVRASRCAAPLVR